MPEHGVHVVSAIDLTVGESEQQAIGVIGLPALGVLRAGNVIRIAYGAGRKQFQLRDILADGRDVGQLAGSHRGADFGAIRDQNRSLIGNDLNRLRRSAQLHLDINARLPVHIHHDVVLLGGLESGRRNDDVVRAVRELGAREQALCIGVGGNGRIVLSVGDLDLGVRNNGAGRIGNLTRQRAGSRLGPGTWGSKPEQSGGEDKGGTPPRADPWGH